MLGAAAAMAVGGPILIGLVNAPRSHAQSKAETLSFEVASIKPSDPNIGGVRIQLMPDGGLLAVWPKKETRAFSPRSNYLAVVFFLPIGLSFAAR